MKSTAIDITGQRFGQLTVIERYKDPNKTKRAKWICVCDCGNTKTTTGFDLRQGSVKSCGCLKAKKKGNSIRKTRLYRTWVMMRQRCYSKKHAAFYLYGGRGIKICDEWSDFEKFREWALSNGYKDDLTIDRIDVNGDYHPSNCRWANAVIQANNRRTNRLITINGVTKTMAEWSRETGVNYKTLFSRYKLLEKRGMDLIIPTNVR